MDESPDLKTEKGIITFLHRNNYPSCQKAERLPEGFGSFVFRAHLSDPNQPPSVIVKHVEGYAARATTWKLDQSRLSYENEMLDFLSTPEMQSGGGGGGGGRVRAPKPLLYDNDAHTLIIEDVGSLPSLKGWCTPGASVDTAVEIGQALGIFLAKLHNYTAGKADLLKRFNGNSTAKLVSGAVYFGRLVSAAERWGYRDEYFKDVAETGQQEVHEAQDVLTVGDFWTGNILVSAPGRDDDDLRLYALDFELSKPGTAAFDVGQMAAEMYCIAAFRNEKLGIALLEAFLESYRQSRDGGVDAAKVAIRIGVHLLVMMPSAWQNEAKEESIKEAVEVGKELVRMGWEKNAIALKGSIVGKLT